MKRISNKKSGGERVQLMLDTAPFCINVIDKNYNNIDCNLEAVKLFGMRDKQEYIEKFWELHPERQPDGKNSHVKAKEFFDEAYAAGYCRVEWMHQKLDGEPVPCEVTLVRAKHRGDDIILAYTRDLREYNQMMDEIKRRDELLHTVNLAATVMLSIENDDRFDDSFISGLELVGQGMGVDRVQIWQNLLIDGDLHFVHRYEWLSSIGEQKGAVPIGLKFSYREKEEWKEMFLRGEYINTPLSKMSPDDQAFLSVFQIQSIVIIPLFLQNQFWGFFSIDDCREERVFSEEDINILRSASLMMASAFDRHTQIADIHRAENDLRLARDVAESANQAKSTFIANMSHEIRTPINSIIGFAELSLDDGIPPKTKDYLNKILDNSEWLLQIINDILDVSKIESGRLNLENIPFDLHEILAHCQTMIMPKALEKGLLLHFYAEPSVGKKLLGDPTRLRQVLINLLTNAVKFTNVGTVKVSSTIIGSADDSITMHFEIRDSGIGMTPGQIENMYEPFMQADASMTRRYGGTGLGIPITKNIVELMGGKLEVESMPGVGSKFSFDLTFNTIDDPAEISNDVIQINNFDKPIFEGEVLVCEDNAMNQQVICEHLKRVGLQSVVAKNGKEGVDIVRGRVEKGEKPFDLIFMDIHMPVMDGLEAASIITGLQTGTPIVAMTANIMASDKELYEKSGLPDCVSKPFTSQVLWRCLMKYLKPADRGAANSEQQKKEEAQFIKQLKTEFAWDNQARFSEIVLALDKNDLQLAFRLAHTLKGNAGQLGKNALQKASAQVESALKDGENLVTPDMLALLEAELALVLNEFAPLLDESRLTFVKRSQNSP